MNYRQLHHNFMLQFPDVIRTQNKIEDLEQESALLGDLLKTSSSSFTVYNFNKMTETLEAFNAIYKGTLQPVYNVQNNMNKMVLSYFNSLGMYFSCSNLNEMNACIAAGIPVEKINFTHFSKEQGTICGVKATNIKDVVCYSVHDIENLDKYYKETEISLSYSSCRVSATFCEFRSFEDLKVALLKCKELGFKVKQLYLTPEIVDMKKEEKAAVFKKALEFLEFAESQGMAIKQINIGSDENSVEDFCLILN